MRHERLARPRRPARQPRAYLEAKRRIVAFQGPEDWTVVNADDPGAVELASTSRARLLRCTLRGPAGQDGAGVESGRLVVRVGGAAHDLGPLGALPPAPGAATGILAGASALLAGACPAAIAGALAAWQGLALRRERIGTVGGAAVIRDALAATPAKAAAGLALHDPGTVVLVAGGYDDLGAGAMHSAPGEQVLFARAAAVAARACTHAALFGPAGPRLAEALASAGLASVAVHPTLAAAAADARTHAAPGRTILFAPWFSTTPDERASFPERARPATALTEPHVQGQAPNGAPAARSSPRRGSRRRPTSARASPSCSAGHSADRAARSGPGPKRARRPHDPLRAVVLDDARRARELPRAARPATALTEPHVPGEAAIVRARPLPRPCKPLTEPHVQGQAPNVRAGRTGLAQSHGA